LSSVDIRWENSIDENIYLAPMITFPAISKKQHKNIIVLIIDALVPEIMGIYNGDFNADNISRFFKDSIIFTNAYAQGEWTLPNFASIAQALYLKHHGVYDPDLYSKPMSTDFKTIAEILQEHGYNTLGYFTGPRLSPGYGHMRGFHRYIYRPFYVGVKKSDNLTITTNAIKFLQKNQRTNNFLFLHYIDTHKPFFQSPENISGRHEAIFNYHIKHSKQEMALGNKNAFYYLRELYIQKFKEVDENLQMLFDYISKYEDDQTTVILTSDHGTPLFDDMEMKNVTKVKKSWKAASFLESVLKVPFMIRLPKSKNHMFNLINEPVEANITILPTVLDIAEIPKPDKIDGITSISNKSKTMMGKGYVIAESIFKTRYNLFVKTKDFKYYLKTGRNRATDEIQSHPGVELFFDLHDKSIEDPNEIQQIKKQVKNILKNEKLENGVS